MLFTNKMYNRLKWIAQYLLPASATLYFGLASIWGLPYAQQIMGTITAFDIFLGVILGISTGQYKKSDMASDGNLLIDQSDPNKDIYRLDVGSIDDLAEKKTITLCVKLGQDLSSPS